MRMIDIEIGPIIALFKLPPILATYNIWCINGQRGWNSIQVHVARTSQASLCALHHKRKAESLTA